MTTPTSVPISKPQRLRGVVVSAGKMKQTVTVLVARLMWHEKIHKQSRRSKKYLVHDEKNEARMGDSVVIEQTRPLSRSKRFRLAKIVTRGKQIDVESDESVSGLVGPEPTRTLKGKGGASEGKTAGFPPEQEEETAV